MLIKQFLSNYGRATIRRPVLEKLTEGNYFELRNDPASIKRVKKTLKEYFLIVSNLSQLRMPNPFLPRIRRQPKVYQKDNEMREIIAASNFPTYNIVAGQ